MPELRALASYYKQAGGAVWVAPAEKPSPSGRGLGEGHDMPGPDRPGFDPHPNPLPEGEGAVLGMVAVRPGAGAWEVCRMYVHPALHGTGLAHRLLDTAERHAIAHGAPQLVLWSDTKFHRAHRFYEKRGYVRASAVRALHDMSGTLEFGFAKPAIAA